MPSYVAVLPDGSEYFEEGEIGEQALVQIAGNAVRKNGLTTSRTEPKPVIVVVQEIAVRNGKLDRIHPRKFNITPPLQRMTEEEFQAEMTEILKDIPVEFQGFISYSSWEHGHSCWREEVVSIANEMASELIKPIEAYAKRIKKELEDASS